MERCVADPECRPTALRNLAQQLVQQRAATTQQLAELGQLVAEQQQQIAAQQQQITSQQQQIDALLRLAAQ